MTAEEAKKPALHVLFFPFLAHGHMIPLFDVARLFVARNGVNATIMTTPGNAAVFSKIINNTSLNIHLEIIPFPSEEVGLRSGIENLEYITNDDDYNMFLDGIRLLESPLEEVLERLRPRPSCIVSDMFLPWTADVAERFGVPRLSFHGSGYFPMSALDALRQQKPFLGVQSEDEEFVVPGLPRVVMMTRRKMASYWKDDPDPDERKRAIVKVMHAAFEAEKRSFGVVMNSFEELEPDYAEHYRKVMGRRAWSIGPVSLYNRNIEDKAVRGKLAAIDEHECLRWLDSKPPNSVIYISFGSVVKMSTAQLREIALALGALDQHFIWVIRGSEASEEEGWLPSWFEELTRDKGLIIRGWAPQVMILDHRATGGFMTHCGWNSTLEGISAGVTMITWPVFAEQFLNEKLITDVLNVGASVGAKQYFDRVVERVSVGREAVEKAVRGAMVGEEAEEMRRKVEKLKEMAWKVVKEGGSSCEGLSDLLKELRSFHVDDEY